MGGTCRTSVLSVRRLHLDQHTSFHKRIAAERFVAWPARQSFFASDRQACSSHPGEWTFDDGQPLGSYNTQQHWVVHNDTLYLLYTRRGANNDPIMRHRAPIFIAQVDPERHHVLRASERIVFPEENADLGGGYAIVEVSPTETWVVTSEVPTRGSRNFNRVLLARLVWEQPNRAFRPPTTPL